MERHFDTDLGQLKELLIGMAGYVERAISDAIQALQMREVGRIKSVFAAEMRVNQNHISVDESCVKLLALKQPLAADLRLIVAIIKINTDLERMGDQAVNIAKNTELYLKKEPLKPLIDLPIMFQEVKSMVRGAIDAFVKADLELSHEVLLRDDKVDDLKRKIFEDVVEHLKNHPDKMEQGLCLILIARNLEKIADHATNIAEDVIYAVTGKDIRHASSQEPLRKVP